MRSFFKFAILFLFFHTVIFLPILSQQASDNGQIVQLDSTRAIISLASNGNVLVVVLQTKLLFYPLNPDGSFLSESSFSTDLNEESPLNRTRIEVFPDNKFVLCLTSTCRQVSYLSKRKGAHTFQAVSNRFEWKEGGCYFGNQA
jgi:hypothetical protein